MDLLAVDRAVAAAFAAHRRAGEDTGWEAHRSVSGQRTLRELAAFAPSEIDKPFAAALARHVVRLTVLRVSQDAERRVGATLKDARAVVRLERAESLPYADVWKGLLAARSPGEARAYFAALADFGPALAEPLRELRQTREEIQRRLGVEDASSYFVGVPHATLVDSARAWLAASRDLARDVTRPRADEERWPLDLDLRLARHAALGWPARLSWRSVSELLAGLPSKPPLALGKAPDPVGAASFVRALSHVGAAFRRAAAPGGLPFALREPPVFVDATRTGALFAAATLEPAFHRRALGLSPGQASDQARSLARSALLSARLAASRVVLGEPGADHEEISAELFGAPLPASLAGVWPRATERSDADWLALVTAAARYGELREREGDDWFRSPRAFQTLRERFGAADEKAPEPREVTALARSLEERLA
ncbi:MAG TPA: hypothetical protein VLM85_12895 [Polyangiaceae bacterium]|nr:hypothetical protein [Polyangiaceae bacterium]